MENIGYFARRMHIRMKTQTQGYAGIFVENYGIVMIFKLGSQNYSGFKAFKVLRLRARPPIIKFVYAILFSISLFYSNFHITTNPTLIIISILIDHQTTRNSCSCEV